MDLQNMREFYCDVCFELFGEGKRCPRILACGHSFCHSCLENLLVQSPTCPNCKQGIQFTSVDCIPVNYAIKSLVSRFKVSKCLNGHDSQLNSTHSDLTRELKEDSVDSLSLKKELSLKEFPYEGYCEDHSNYQQLRCMDCKCWVCGMCATFDHKLCRTVLVEEALDEMKEEIRQEFIAEIEAQKLQSKNLDKVLLDLEMNRLSINNEIEMLQLDLKRKLEFLKSIDKDIESFQSIKSDCKKHSEKFTLLKSVVEETTNDDQFMKAKNKWNELLIESKKLMEELTICRYSLCHFSLEILRDWCHDNSVYASRCQNGFTQYGKVVVKGDRVWVHRFKPQRPPEQNVIVSFRYLLMNTSGSSALPRRGFLQVKDGSSDLSDVVIATDALTPRAKNFLLFCSGIKGRSYEGNQFSNEGWCIESIYKEGAVVRGIKDGGVYEAPRKKGFVSGCYAKDTNSLSGFGISVQDNTTTKFPIKFGFVEEGIDVCSKIFYNGKKHCTIIKHCGLVI